MELRIHCKICGWPTPHINVGNQPEKDEDGRAYQRMECSNCGMHERVYNDATDEDSQENEQQQPEA